MLATKFGIVMVWVALRQGTYDTQKLDCNVHTSKFDLNFLGQPKKFCYEEKTKLHILKTTSIHVSQSSPENLRVHFQINISYTKQVLLQKLNFTGNAFQ